MIIEGKTALVIGGARGVGKEYVRHLLEKGAKVRCVYCVIILLENSVAIDYPYYSEECLPAYWDPV